MLWLIIILSAYFLFALVSLGDKYLLKGPLNSKTLSFYVGILGGLALFLIPFVGFSVPGSLEMLFCLAAGSIYIFTLLGLYEGLEKFEASRIIPAIGGFLPLFIFGLTYFFSRGQEVLGLKEISAFITLILGSIFISYNPLKKVSFKSLQVSVLTAFLLSLTFVLTKYVYLMMPFWNGFIWIRITALITALLFIFFKEVRREIFSGRPGFDKKTGLFFAFNQSMGAGAFILQNWAIALAGMAYLSIITALQGVQYVFLFIFTIILSLKLPRILKEEISKRIVFQKIFAIILIAIGLVILAIK